MNRCRELGDGVDCREKSSDLVRGCRGIHGHDVADADRLPRIGVERSASRDVYALDLDLESLRIGVDAIEQATRHGEMKQMCTR
jgi:hypothetical protein